VTASSKILKPPCSLLDSAFRTFTDQDYKAPPGPTTEPLLVTSPSTEPNSVEVHSQPCMMVRHGARSRGCQRCLQRKIKVQFHSNTPRFHILTVKGKCDESAPECSQCRISGAECSGPRQGTLFVDMSAQIRQKSEKRKTATEQKERMAGSEPFNFIRETSQYKPFEVDVPSATIDSGSKAAPRSNSVEKARPSRTRNSRAVKSKNQEPASLYRPTNHELHFQLPTTYQPDRRYQFELLFLSNFISSSNLSEKSESGLHTWTNELVNILSSTKESSVIYSIRATSMAMYGRMTGTEDIEIEAIKWYSRGLESQRQSLQLAAKAPTSVIPTDGTVCTAIMLSLFESIISTTPTGWLRHYGGAVKMLEVMGPEKCQSKLTHKLFRSARFGSVSPTLDRVFIISNFR